VKFTACPLAGAYTIDSEPIRDERGFFARVWCREEFHNVGLTTLVEQSSVSFNQKRGTLRGLHYQAAPKEEVKLVRCTRGAMYDVILDLRPRSPTFRRWFATELNDENGRMIYVPAGFAHGFQTLSDGTEVLYQISERYHPNLAKGVRWDDPFFAIAWPNLNPILSERDRNFPDYVVSVAGITADR